MNMHTLNIWAILVAAVSAFFLGALWYGPFLFGKAWQRANGFGEAPPATNMGKVFGISFLLTLVMSFNLAMFLNDPKTTTSWGATAGFLAGFGWCFMGLGSSHSSSAAPGLRLQRRLPNRCAHADGRHSRRLAIKVGTNLG